MNDEFTEMLIRNDEDEESSWLLSYGKKPNPMPPIFMFDDVDKEELDKYLAKDRKEKV